jgi:cell division protein FtsZ
MPQVNKEIETFARIKVLGVGGSGKNALEHMIQSKVKGVDFVAINTDSQDLHHSSAKKKIHIGKNTTKGLGAGMNPEVGRRAAEETQAEIQEAVKGSDMIFITFGAGGGTGSGSAPIAAKIAKESGALTIAVCTKPFGFEGKQRMRIAEEAISELRKVVDAIIVIPNDRLLQTIDKQTSVRNTFSMSDEVLKQAVEGISDLITTAGYVNVDFADVRSVLENAGSALMGIGASSGEKRAEEAAKMAINSPLLELSISGAKGVLFSIAGGDDLTAFEMQEAANIITENVDENARIIFGLSNDSRLKKNEIKVTVIAAGFPEEDVNKALFSQSEPVVISSPVLDEEDDDESDDKDDNKLFNSVPFMQKKETPEKGKDDDEVDGSKKDENEKEDDDDDDDWGSVPSFLRRSKLK